jgi:hypothetical protein
MSAQEFHNAVDAYFETGDPVCLRILTTLVEIERLSLDARRMRADAGKPVVSRADYLSTGSPRT